MTLLDEALAEYDYRQAVRTGHDRGLTPAVSVEGGCGEFGPVRAH
jgi:hypothetical protein